MKYLFVLALVFVLNKNSFCQVKTGDKYGGIVKLTTAVAKNNVNGKWNTADNTGNSVVDSLLNNFATANKNNPKAIAALENAAADVRSNPVKFINPDGSVNKEALSALLQSQFAAASVTVPSPSVLIDSNTNKSMRDL
jgi:hypothetical protein